MAQTTENTFNPAVIRRLNTTIRRVRNSPKVDITHWNLDKSSLRLSIYSDGAFANTPDGSSQLGYLIALTDESKRCNVLTYRSFKSKRVTRPVLGAQTSAFAEAFYCAFILKADI